jgi:hypothetical protein
MCRTSAIYALTAISLLLAVCPATGQEVEIISDTLSAASQERIDSLQASFERNRIGKLLADYIFVTRLDQTGASGDAMKSEDPFVAHVGKFIREIEIYRINILSDTRVGTKNPELPALVRGIEHIHVDTRESKIASFLLFEEGDGVDPYALADSERLLRGTSFIQDARIVVKPVEDSPDSVDVQVVTRDLWSIGLRYTWVTETKHRAAIYERNLAGYGQRIEFEVFTDIERDRKNDYTILYVAPNIFGTFVDGLVRFTDAVDFRSNEFALSRGYISPDIRWIGGITIEAKDDLDEDPSKIRKWDRQDFWVGRTFRIGRGYTGEGSRMRLVPAFRVTRTDYHVRPEVNSDLNRRYHDKTSYFGSLTLTERSFRKMRMVFSYGKTEDIPYGFLASATGGNSVEEFYTRPYGGAELSYGNFFGRSNYLIGRGAIGGYYRDREWEDGTLSLTLGGFSQLLPFFYSAARHFLVIDYIYGFNRLPSNTVALEEPRGDLRGMRNTGIEGHQRMTISWEGVLLADFDWWGFRFAGFGYAETGQCGMDWNSFTDSDWYWSLGCGLRVSNERLIFSTYEVRFMYHPIVPEGAITESVKFEAVRNIRIPFLSPGAPRIIKYE